MHLAFFVNDGQHHPAVPFAVVGHVVAAEILVIGGRAGFAEDFDKNTVGKYAFVNDVVAGYAGAAGGG